MPTNTRLKLHDGGRALWPERKSEKDALKTRDETPATTWWGTYQGIPSAPGGTIFLEQWWADENTRYDPNERGLINKCIARYLSWDTAESENETAAYSSVIAGEILPDYRLVIRDVRRKRLTFPKLLDFVEGSARTHSRDEKLRGIVIENASSGVALIQSIDANAELWYRRLVHPFNPSVSKEERAKQASVHCRNGSVLLPLPDDSAPWLLSFEEELFNFPGSDYMDQVDAFSQLIIFLEHFLSRGYAARRGKQ